MSKKIFLLPFIFVTSLFFLWGFSYGLLDVLNKHFQETLNITKARSTLLQATYFGAYFILAFPAGMFMNRYGYKKGIIIGLLLFSSGAFLFYPAAQQANFNFFLIAFFVLASGLACLETAANPYITVLGVPEKSAARLNLSQSFNGVGTIIGPLIAAKLFFGEGNSNNLDNVTTVYLIIGIVVLVIAGFFIFIRLPEIREGEIVSSVKLGRKPLFKHSNFTMGVIAQFFYVAAQVGIAALFINYCTESGVNITNEKAATLFGVSLILFTAGRFTGTALMRKIRPEKLLTVYALINVALCVVVILKLNWVSIYSLMIVFFFESIMFPTIFALAVKDVGHHTKKASSFQIMSIVGGAIVPFFMGILADKYSTAFAYIIPLICFLIVAWYGKWGCIIKEEISSEKELKVFLK